MSLHETPEIARSFLEWTTDEVLKWLSTLSLSRDYSSQFTDHNITGVRLIKLNPAALDILGITEGADRVKILQQITTMRADLIPTSFSPTKRNYSPIRMRRFSETARPVQRGGSGRIMRHTTSASTLERTLSPTKTPVREARSPRVTSPSYFSDQTSIDSPGSSRMSSPVKLMAKSPQEARMHFILETDEEEGEGGASGCVLRANASALRDNQRRRLSRSLDGLLQDPDVFYPPLERRDSCSSCLVEILREENATLKKELERYYRRVRKLQKLEQEVEHIREGYRLLEASTARREKLETAMREKLEMELRKVKETSLQQKATELHSVRRQSTDKSSKKEIARRDTMIMRLIKQNKDAAAARERLEKDLHSTKAVLKQKTDQTEGVGSVVSDSHNMRGSSETESKAALMYSESIEKLRSVLLAMQGTSEKRERLEKRMRNQLERELKQLRGEKRVRGNEEGDSGEGVEEWRRRVVEQEGRISTLEADVAKWELKCLELVAEKQMSLETAIIPRDTRISQLEQSLAEREDCLLEMRQQRSKYITQLSENTRKIAELETRLSSMQSSLEEKDSIIHMLQQSFLDPDDQPANSTITDSSPLYRLGLSPQHPHWRARGSPGATGGEILAKFSPTLSRREVLCNGVAPPLASGMHGYTNMDNERLRTAGMVDPSMQLQLNGGGPYSPVHRRNASPMHSSSAPTTPKIKARKPKMSHPNLLFPPASTSAPGSVTSSPAITRQRARGLKSKTPPPSYRVTSSKSQQHEGSRQRHRSVDGLLDDMDPLPGDSQNGQLDLFESLLGESMPPTIAPPFINGGYTHQHSKSSPTADRVHL